jgi:hypothetical protein
VRGRANPEVFLESDFEIEGKGIDTSALQEELARRVEERRRSGVYDREVEAALAERLPDEMDAGGLSPVSALDYAATRAQASWEVSTAYEVETDKSFARPLVILAKRLARLWARIAVGPIQREQTAFNRHVADGLEAVKRQAIAQRAQALAFEEDLAQLAGSMIEDEEAVRMAGALSEGLGTVDTLTAVGPCPRYLLESLQRSGCSVYRVSPGTPWDEVEGAHPSTLAGPLTFLGQVAEDSVEDALICDLAFWLKPETLIRLTRQTYLALKPGGRVALVVHSFAAGAPAPAWCASPVITSALEMAGFTDISITPPQAASPGTSGSSPSGYVAVANKRQR